MISSLSWRQIGVVAGLAATGFLAGLGAGAALVGGSLPTEIAGALAGLVLLILTGAGAVGRVVIDRVVAALGPQLDHNTGLTEQAMVSAQAAELAARAINDCQVNQAELDVLRRWHMAFETLPECQVCKDAIGVLIDRRRLRPPMREP